MKGEIVFAALYLPGLMEWGCRPSNEARAGLSGLGSKFSGGASPRRWAQVEFALRESLVGLFEIEDRLRKLGFWEEASVLAEPNRISAAENAVMGGFCLTALGDYYPANWRKVLGSAAPPAVWCFTGLRAEFGGLAAFEQGANASGRTSLVGSRTISQGGQERARAMGATISQARHLFCSGGAPGTDRAGIGGFLETSEIPAIEILPFGIEFGGSQNSASFEDGHFRRRLESGSVVQLSVCHPKERFSARRAMQRNALIYSFADQAVVISPHFRRGGTWHGAVDALRRNLSRVFVAADGLPGSEALMQLGAIPLQLTADEEGMRSRWLAAMLTEGRKPVPQPMLFGAREVREEHWYYGGA